MTSLQVLTPVAKIRRFYESNPGAIIKFDSDYSPKLVSFLARIEDNPPCELSPDILDSRDVSENFDLELVLSGVDPKFILDEFGQKMLVWVTLNSPYTTISRRFDRAISELTDIDIQTLERSSLYAWQFLGTAKTSEVMNLYHLTCALDNGILEEVNLPKLLKRCAKEGVTLSDKRIKNYSLESIVPSEDTDTRGYERTWGKKIHRNKVYSIYLDAPIGITLMYKGEPSAIVTFGTKDSHVLMIYQMQGVRVLVIDYDKKVVVNEHTRGLAVLDMRRFLVELTKELMNLTNSQSGTTFEQLAIRSGHNNRWTEEYNDGKIHLPLDEALRIYDGTATDLGFSLGKDRNWYKPLANFSEMPVAKTQ